MLLSLCLLTGCSFRPLHETLHVVGEADSLWHQGQMYDDSTQLARTYSALHAWRAFYADEYAHACYHYGKLLRAKENPVEAMQAFIAATHSGTKDYHILGRVYSNMGSICHLADEFQLSYDMYEKSADMYLKNGDSLLYYYDLNNMAFELAGQGEKEKANCLLLQIKGCEDHHLNALKTLTIAKAYAVNNQSDSVLYILNQSPCNYTLHYVLRANAYWHLEKMDSALYYAQKVMTMPDVSEQDKYNMLYIILNYDNTLQNEDIIGLSARRSDIETDVLIPLHNKLAVDMKLLEQDLHRKPDYRWLYAILLTLVVGGASIYAYIHWKRRQHALLSQHVDDLAIQNKEAEAQHEKIIGAIEKHKRTITDEVEQNCKLIIKAESFPQNIYWNKYKKMCSIVDKRFYMLASKLHTKYKLNETETRLCVLTLLDCKYDLIADLLYRSNSSIGTLKIRVAKKLGTTAKDLRMYLIENECVN